MNTLSRLLLFVPALCIAQVFTSPIPEGVRQYLALTDAQGRAILSYNAAFEQTRGVKLGRIFDVRREIAVEAEKEVLDPTAFGLRYMEIEQLTRQMNSEYAKLRDSIRALLTEPQRVKQKALEDANKLQPLISEAQRIAVVEDPYTVGPPFSPFPGNIIPVGRLNPVPLFPPELSQYLALSTAQMTSILQLNGSYDAGASMKRRRISMLQAEIARETAKEALDPMALGTRYVEIEELSRQMKNDRVALRDQNRAVLTDVQRARLQSLDAAGKLRPAIAQAECEDLLEPAPTVSGTLSVVERSGDFSGVIGGILESPAPLRLCQSGGFTFFPLFP